MATATRNNAKAVRQKENCTFKPPTLASDLTQTLAQYRSQILTLKPLQLYIKDVFYHMQRY